MSQKRIKMLIQYCVPMMILAAFNWANFNRLKFSLLVERLRSLKRIMWAGIIAVIATLTLLASPAHSAESLTTQHDLNCLISPECYAKTHKTPSHECQVIIENKAHFPIQWRGEKGLEIFDTFYWYDTHKKIVQMFGRQATTQNSLGMEITVRYYCIFNSDSGEVITASFE